MTNQDPKAGTFVIQCTMNDGSTRYWSDSETRPVELEAATPFLFWNYAQQRLLYICQHDFWGKRGVTDMWVYQIERAREIAKAG